MGALKFPGVTLQASWGMIEGKEKKRHAQYHPKGPVDLRELTMAFDA